MAKEKEPVEIIEDTAGQTDENSIEAGSPGAETPKTDEDTTGYGDYPPGTIVLAKMKSFPPWPAIVVPKDLIPENILKSKPKHSSVSVGNRRKAQEQEESHNLWCVRFLRDDNFMWATNKDIQILSKESIESFLNAKKKPKKSIKAAYEMALNPPDLEEFIIYGSDGKPIAIDNEADDADFEDEYIEDEVNEDDDDGSLESEVEDEDDTNLEIEIPTKKRKAKKESPVKRGRKKGTKVKAAPAKATPSKRGRKKKVVEVEEEEEQEPETSSDEDWEADHEPDETPVAVDIPSSKEMNDLLKKKIQQVKKTRLQFQSSFLENKELDNVDVKLINSLIDGLEKLNPIESSLIKTTGLYKVLFDILKRPDLISKDLKKLRTRLNRLVLDLYDIKIETNEKWDFIDREESEALEENGEEVKDEETNGVKEEDVKEEVKEEESEEVKENGV